MFKFLRTVSVFDMSHEILFKPSQSNILMRKFTATQRLLE